MKRRFATCIVLAAMALASVAHASLTPPPLYSTSWSGDTLTATWDMGAEITAVYPLSTPVVLFDLTSELTGKKVTNAWMTASFTSGFGDLGIFFDGKELLGAGGAQSGLLTVYNLQNYLQDKQLDVRAAAINIFGATPSIDLNSVELKVQATPIPGAVWLLGSGLLGLIGIRRRFA